MSLSRLQAAIHFWSFTFLSNLKICALKKRWSSVQLKFCLVLSLWYGFALAIRPSRFTSFGGMPINRPVRVVWLVNTLDDPYGSYKSIYHHYQTDKNPSIIKAIYGSTARPVNILDEPYGSHISWIPKTIPTDAVRTTREHITRSIRINKSVLRLVKIRDIPSLRSNLQSAQSYSYRYVHIVHGRWIFRSWLKFIDRLIYWFL